MAKFNFYSLLNSLPAFEAAARLQSVKKACEELHVTHSAVSRHIKRIETHLNRRLFDRSHRKVVLTDDGELLLGAVRVGFSHVQHALTQLQAMDHPGRLVISVDPDFAALWLVPRLAEFYAIMPYTLVEILAEKTALSVTDPRIGCAIQYAEAGLEIDGGEALFRSRLFPVCAQNLPPSATVNSWEDLRHRLLLHDRSISEWEQYLQSSPAPIGMNPKSGIIFSDTAHCLDAAARGLGIALGDDFLAATHLSEGRLVRPFGSAVLSKNAYYLLVPDNASRQPAVHAFRTWLRRSIDRQRDASDGH